MGNPLEEGGKSRKKLGNTYECGSGIVDMTRSGSASSASSDRFTCGDPETFHTANGNVARHPQRLYR
jgi:hypothetical protein